MCAGPNQNRARRPWIEPGSGRPSSARPGTRSLLPVVGWPNSSAPRPSSGGGRRRRGGPARESKFNGVVPAPSTRASCSINVTGPHVYTKKISIELAYIDTLANSKIRLNGVKRMTQIQNTSQSFAATKYFRIEAREHTLAPPGRHRPRHSRIRLTACQSTPAIDAAFYRPDSTLSQLQPSFHTHSTEPEPTARAWRAGEEFYMTTLAFMFVPFRLLMVESIHTASTVAYLY